MPNESDILAKSEPQITLRQHIDDGLLVWQQLQLSFPNIPVIDKKKFWKELKDCIVFHDLGKAHSEFQHVLRQEKIIGISKGMNCFQFLLLIVLI